MCPHFLFTREIYNIAQRLHNLFVQFQSIPASTCKHIDPLIVMSLFFFPSFGLKGQLLRAVVVVVTD